MELEQKNTITLPGRLFNSMIEAYQKWQTFGDELEDFLSASDKEFIKKMRSAREEHLSGRTKPLRELEQELAF